MITESLCYFPATKGRRTEKAERAIRRVLDGCRPRLRRLIAAALVVQILLLPIPLAMHHWLPMLLDSAATSATVRMTTLSLLIVLIAAAGGMRSLANYYFNRQAGILGHAFVAELRSVAYAQIMRLPVSYVESRGAGKILLRFIGDADALRSWVSKSGPRLVADSITAIAIVVGLLILSWKLMLVLAIPLSVFLVILLRLTHPVREATRQARRLQSRLTGRIEHSLNNIRHSKIEDARSGLRREVEGQIKDVAALNAERDWLAAVLEAWAQLTIFAALPLLLLAGFPMVWSQRLAASDFAAFVWLSLHLIVLIRSSLGGIVIHQKALVSVQRMYVLLSRSAERGRSGRRGRLKFRRLSISAGGKQFDFGPGAHILPAEIDLDACMESLLGFRPDKQLRMAIDDVPIEELDVKVRRRRIGSCSRVLTLDGRAGDAGELARLKGLRVIFLLTRQPPDAWSASQWAAVRQWAGSSIVLCAAGETPGLRCQSSLRASDTVLPASLV